jgi:serine-type D-Ala-D-Ala carboxypeptidase/endopeptidase (penicillin-binding protein 4)
MSAPLARAVCGVWARLRVPFILGLAAALAITVVALHSARPSPSPTPLIKSLGFAADDVGFVLVDLRSGRILAERAADAPFIPASVTKLMTAYAAEQILGSDFRFSTLLSRRGADLYLQGGGDPVLTADDLQTLVMRLPAATSAGSVERLFYDDSLIAAMPEVANSQPMAAVYNAGFGALNVDFNRIEVVWSRRHGNGDLEFHTSSIADGQSVPTEWITFAPAPDDLPLGAPFLYAGDGAADRWLYSARLPDRGVTFLPVKSTSLHTALVFRELAKSAGIDLPMPQPGRLPADAQILGRIDSRPLAEIMPGLLHFSNNLSAELIGLAATRKLTGRMPSIGESSRVLTEWLEARLPGTDWRGFRMENHSGFSSKSRVTPRQMADLLTMFAGDRLLMDAMPRLDATDVAATSGAGSPPPLVVGKSGTMDYATGLAGYITAGDGRRLAFAIFISDRNRRAALDATMDRRILEPSPQAREWIDRARALDRALLRSWAASL